ncbi:C2 domain-containing protein [Lactarius pseudohatsudake]|nr:C2 domain-containing protein [Lactarius pseudohatsudake]
MSSIRLPFVRRVSSNQANNYSPSPDPGDTPVVCLRVQVISCYGLVAMDHGESSDPFVTVSLLDKQFQTPVVKQNLDPEYEPKNATFDFPIYKSLGPKLDTLNFVVWDKNKFSKNVYLGEYSLPVNRWFRGTFDFDDPNNEPFPVHLVSSRPMTKPVGGTMSLKVGFVHPSNSTPQVDFGSTYNALITNNKHLKAGIMMVEIRGIKNLPEWPDATRVGFDMDPFVKVSVGEGPGDVGCTSVMQHTLNPEWNEQLFFHVGQVGQDLSLPIRLTVFHRDKFTPDDFVGEVVIADAFVIEKVDQEVDLNIRPPYPISDLTNFVVRSLTANPKRPYTAGTPEITFRAKYLPYV